MALFKGAVVYIPLATAGDSRNVPKLYGEDVKSHGEVTDIVSGFQVAAKNFALGIVRGFSDPFKQLYELAETEGAEDGGGGVFESKKHDGCGSKRHNRDVRETEGSKGEGARNLFGKDGIGMIEKTSTMLCWHDVVQFCQVTSR